MVGKEKIGEEEVEGGFDLDLLYVCMKSSSIQSKIACTNGICRERWPVLLDLKRIWPRSTQVPLAKYFKQKKFVSYRSRGQKSAIGGANKGGFKKGCRPQFLPLTSRAKTKAT